MENIVTLPYKTYNFNSDKPQSHYATTTESGKVKKDCLPKKDTLQKQLEHWNKTHSQQLWKQVNSI